MKKFINIITCLLAFSLCSCDLFEFDNYDEPDAQVHGRLIDAKTGENVGVECYVKSSGNPWIGYTYEYFGSLNIVEQGWDGQEDQAWNVMFNGVYNNERVFSGSYKMSTKNLPCYLQEEDFSVKSGKNNVDFTVVPFARVINPQFSYDASSKKIKATFKVELGDASKANTIAVVRLCAYTDCHVCRNYNLCTSDPGAVANNVADGETVTLEIDTTLPSNNEEFQYKRNHYLRIAVLANGNNFNTSGAYNFSETYVMSSDFQKIDKFDWNN